MNDLTIYDTLAESWWHAGSPLHLLGADESRPVCLL